LNNFLRKLSPKRAKTPTILQMEAVECGAAALAMILAYHGRQEPLEKLRLECGVSRDGSKASNMLKAARKYGLEARGFRKEPEGLSELKPPMILFWNFNHFVVFEGFKGKRAYLNDPASGPKIVPMEEFDQCFTGVVLTFKKEPEFKKGGTKRRTFQLLRSRLRGNFFPLFYVFLAGLFLVIPGLVIPIFSKIFVDNILVGKMDSWIQPLLLAMGLTALARGILTWLQEHYLLRLETKLALSGSARFFRHVFRLPIEFFSQRMSGDISNRVQLNDKVAQLLSGELASNMLNVVMIVFYAALMLQYDILLTMIGIGVALLNLVVLKYVSGKRVTINQKLQQENGKLIGVSMTGLQMIESLKASGSESDFFAQWSGQQTKVVNAQQELSVPSQIMAVIPTFLMTLNNIIILSIGGFRVMNGFLSMGSLVAFQSLMSSFMSPVNQMVNLGGKLQEAKADMCRLEDVLNYPQDQRFTSELEETDMLPDKLSGYVDIQNIAFGYSVLEKPLIEDFSLSLKPGSNVAIVGGSGSGKSTVAKIVSSLYEPRSGEIRFDKRLRNSYPTEVMNNSLSMVDQDIFLFEGTIQENITMWDQSLNDADIYQAAKDACIHYDIASRAGGYSSEVEEGGANFSGGQRQRIEIARALVTNPTILIMDEATSALDANIEKRVTDNIKRRGCTCLIIAHRLSTIMDCDEIIVLDHGKVVQRGTHEEMILIEGPYAELIKDY